MSDGWPGLCLPEDGLFLNRKGQDGMGAPGKGGLCMAYLTVSTVQQHCSWLAPAVK